MILDFPTHFYWCFRLFLAQRSSCPLAPAGEEERGLLHEAALFFVKEYGNLESAFTKIAPGGKLAQQDLARALYAGIFATQGHVKPRNPATMFSGY